MEIKIVKGQISKAEVEAMARAIFGDYVKAAVDVEQGIAAFGAGLHADEEAKLLELGSKQENLWGINLYPGKARSEWIEFDSMINVRPSQNNLSRNVEDPEIRRRIQEILDALVSE